MKEKINQFLNRYMGTIILIFLFLQPFLDVFAGINQHILHWNIEINIIFRILFLLFAIVYLLFFNQTKYKKISCTLFEKNDNTIKEINTYYYDNDKEIKIDDFLKDISFNIDDYESKCKSFKNGSLYLEIKAVTVDDKVDIHKIPLVLKDNCK